MLIKRITLKNFRNHAIYSLDCNPDTTLILGENGCGKTSVLEAIYILTRNRSFRATDSEIVKRGETFYHIELEYTSGQTIKATYDLNTRTKTYDADGKKTRRLLKKSKYPVILFEPQDLNLITGSPSKHRDYFDRLFSGLSDDYASALNKYNKAREQRNKLLKTDFPDQNTLQTYNLLLTKFGIILNHYRLNFVYEINQSLNQIYHSIAENSDDIKLAYLSDTTNLTEGDFLNQLNNTFEKDRIMGYTTFGVSRDDYEFIFNQQNASGSASRGESRSIIIALKFVESRLLEQKLGQKPLVLLDDVFSELDNSRREALIQNFKDHQIILTSVEKINL